MEDNNSEQGYSRALSYTNAIAQVYYEVLRKKCPLDREIKNYFRKHKECGPKDRFLITESLFSLFRWYGWVGGALPKDQQQPEYPLESKKLCLGLAAALWLDNQPFDQLMKILYDAAEINTTGLNDSPQRIEDKIKGLSYFFQIRKCNVLNLVPAWFRQEIKDQDLIQMIEPLQRRPPIWIRLQRDAQETVLKELDSMGIVCVGHQMIPNAFKLSGAKISVQDVESYQSGLFEIQDLASQCLGIVCAATFDQLWWDVCAGAGGKSLLLADQMQGKGRVVATDKRLSVLKELEERTARANFKNIQTAELDEVILSQGNFDGVLVDAPCSCTGVWRRNPDLRWSSSDDICRQMASVQKEILEVASKKVKVGGVLVYATCSLSTQENEDIVKHFLKVSPDFMLEDFIHPLTGKSTGGMMYVKFSPDDCDATFAARFRKRA